MFSTRIDPGAHGAGVVFFDAVAADGSRLDLSLLWPDRWRAPDWDRVETELGVPALNVYQVHGDRVVRVDAGTDPRALARERADALVTTSRRVALAVRAADCVPVLFADPDAGVVGAAHAGRVGLGAGVLAATVTRLHELGATRITAWIGPHICGACYEVPESLRDEFVADHPAAAATTSWGTPAIDLGAAAAAQLAMLGCAVVREDPCTRETPSLHSYRRDGRSSGRQAALVWLP